MVTVHGSYVQFRFFRPDAQSVHLAGDFNGWSENQLQMIPAGKGYWLAVMRLPAGSYRFRYLADGQWYTDYAAFGLQPGPFGFDGVVRIAPPPPPAVAAAPSPREHEVEQASPLSAPVLSFAAALAGAASGGPLRGRAA
jgi:hypothetical protein